MIERLMRAYEAFNHRDIEAVLELLDPEVDWPNGMEGGWLHGHAEVREHWKRQWSQTDPQVKAINLKTLPDGRIYVVVRQVVKDLEGHSLLDRMVGHVYTLKEGKLISKMEIEEHPEEAFSSRYAS